MLGQWSLTYQENNDLTFIQKLLKKKMNNYITVIN